MEILMNLTQEAAAFLFMAIAVSFLAGLFLGLVIWGCDN